MLMASIEDEVIITEDTVEKSILYFLINCHMALGQNFS